MRNGIRSYQSKDPKNAPILPVLQKTFITLCAFLSCFALVQAGPTPATPSANAGDIKKLADKLADAPSEPDRDALLAKAPADLLTGYQLREELTDIEFQRTLQGDYTGAETLGRFIIRFATKQGDEEGVATGKLQLGVALREFGQENEAMALLHQSLAYFEKKTGDSRGLVRAAHSLGVVYLYRSDFARALTYLERALNIARKIDYRDGVIPSLNSLGELYRSQGQPERALRLYQEAREIVNDDHAWNMAFLFNNMGQCYEAMGDTAKAIDFVGRAQTIAQKVNFRPRVATSLAVLGNLHMQRAEWDEAKKCYNESLSLSMVLREKPSEARALLGLANVARAQREFVAALEPATRSAAIYAQMGQRADVANAQTSIGRSLRALGRTEEARGAFTKAIDEIEQVRGQVAGGPVEAEKFFAKKLEPYREMVSIFASENRFPEALAISEKASARVLLDMLNSNQPDQDQSLTEPEKKRQYELNRHLVELNHAVKQALDEKKVQTLEIQVAHARDERETFESQLAAERHDARRLPSTEPAALSEIAPLLSDGKTAVLKFVVHDEGTSLFVVHQVEGTAKIDLFPLKIARPALTKRANEFREKLATRALDWQKPATDLYELLLQDSEVSWGDAANLVIIPDGPLWELPFQVLRKTNRCLLEDRAVCYAPSISVLAHLGAKTSPQTNRLFAIGNPAVGDLRKPFAKNVTIDRVLMDEKWRPLPAAEKQVMELRKLYSPERSEILIGGEAREEIVKRDAGQFPILHFATHGILNDRAPLYSYLLLSQDAPSTEEDGLLEGWEVMRMKLHARLAVLSACETARGQVSAGEGMIGLSWALLIAGCPATVVSQWKVESESNTDLMLDFHRELLSGRAPAEALRQASLALKKNPEYRHPFYWAPFIVVGQGL